MKISLNLAKPLGWRERYGLVVGTLALAIGIGVLATLARSTMADFREEQAVEQPITQAQKRLAGLQEKVSALDQYLAQPQFHRLAEETSYLNGLIQGKEFSIVRLTARVSQLLPPDVRVDGLAFSPASTNPMIQVSVEAKSERAFEAFLSNLEGAKDFSDVVVTNQGFGDSTTNSKTIQATCAALYHGAGSVSEGQGITDAETSPQDPAAVH